MQRFKKEVAEGANPRDYKIKLAEEIVARYHGENAAKSAIENFINRFQKGAMPENIPEIDLTIEGDTILLPNLLKQVGLVASTSDAIRGIEQGSVKIDGEKILDKKFQVKRGTNSIYQFGKHKFSRVQLI